MSGPLALLPEAATALEALPQVLNVRSPGDFIKFLERQFDQVPDNPLGIDTSQDRQKIGPQLLDKRDTYADITAFEAEKEKMFAYLSLALQTAKHPIT